LTESVAARTQLTYSAGLLAYPGLVIAAIFGQAWTFALFGLACLTTEAVLQTKAPGVSWNLTRGGIGWTVRSAVRSLSVIIFAATATGYTHPQFIAIALGMSVVEGSRACYSLATTYAKIRRSTPVLTRNIDLSMALIPPLRYGPFERITARGMTALSLLPVVGIAGSAVTGNGAITTAATGLAAVVALFATLTVGVGTMRGVRLPSDERMLAVVHQQVVTYRPEIVIYFSGTTDSLYQINMWLDVVTALPYRSMILMRERANVALLAPTSLPVVCLPSAVDLMNFDLPTVAIAMYAANTGKNIHFLRIPGMMHVFIGHGDSDKIASVNPFSKAYDEIWVAGQAGRDRYARAGVGVEDADIVEVGRPQLASIRHTSEHEPTSAFTVLYAPTWEGWTEDAQNTSVIAMGPTIVATLLSHPGVRVIYKPHPLTGLRDPKALAASRAINAMIERANHLVTGHPYAAARREMEDLAVRISAVGQDEYAADDLDAARNSGHAHADYANEVAALTRDWNRAFWGSQPDFAHRSVTEPLAALADCFNHADLLIADISSVVADYLHSEKPYIVTNSGDLPEAAFRSRYPTAGAAYLLDSGAANLDRIVADLAEGVDPLRVQREDLKAYLLGPEEITSGDRFARAVDRAVERAGMLVHRSPSYGEFDRDPDATTPVAAD
jgi:hypothetical protein